MDKKDAKLRPLELKRTGPGRGKAQQIKKKQKDAKEKVKEETPPNLSLVNIPKK